MIEANRVDQRVARYETWEQLRGYCALSANPVGEIVLGVFGAATPARVALSDAICTALQLAEHCQDVAEDYAAGRVYLPAEDLASFGCDPDRVRFGEPAQEGPDRAALRDVLAFEVERARRLLDQGAPLIGQLRGRERLAVAAFSAGGRSALGAIERAGYDVLGGAPRASKPQRLAALAATLLGRRAGSVAVSSPPRRRSARERRLRPPGVLRVSSATPATTAISTAEAYERCEAITRTEAANFYYGIRLLSGERRRAMCAAYAFARRIDDIGDGPLALERKRELLEQAGAQLAELERSRSAAVAPADPVIVALADAHARFSLPPGALGELIDGVRMDLDGVAYESFDELVLYCRRVAGAIGRVCLAIFATRVPGDRRPRARADRSARRRPRRRAAADEHPARRARGRAERPRLLACRRLAPLRRRLGREPGHGAVGAGARSGGRAWRAGAR